MEPEKLEEIESKPHVLVLNKGKKWDEGTRDGAIASVFTTISYMVFMPRVPPHIDVNGGKLRVMVRAIRDPKGELIKDRSGREIFRATPAPDIEECLWRSSEKTIAKINYIVDWMMGMRETEILEERPLAVREVLINLTPTWRIVWGSSLSDSYLERTILKIFAIDTEKAENGRIVWIKTGERTDPQPSEMVLISDREEHVGGTWYGQRLELNYGAGLTIQFPMKYIENGKEQLLILSDTWGNIPAWLQSEISRPYPVCDCNRQRVNLSRTSERCWQCGSSGGHMSGCREAADSYLKCELCRAEEGCDRCGGRPDNQPLNVILIDGQLICATCQPLFEMEKLVKQNVTARARIAVATEAKKLLAGRAIAQELGEIILASTVDHISDKHVREQVIAAGAGYSWYYATTTGIYGSKFSPEALEILRYYASARGNGLVRMTAWLTGRYHKIDDCARDNDHYHRTQVKGESIQPSFFNSSFAGELSLAIKLRGTESDRAEAVLEYRALVEKLGSEIEIVKKVEETLFSPRQDYSLALQKIEEIKEVVRLKEEKERAEREREEERRQVLAELLAHEMVRDIAHAERIDSFVTDALRIRGAETASLLKEEADAAYGYGTRVACLDEKFPQAGYYGLDWTCGRDIIPVAFWAAKKCPPRNTQKNTTSQTAQKSDSSDAVFEHRGDGHFFCQPCLYMASVTKKVYREYLAGNIILVTCSNCGRSKEISHRIPEVVSQSSKEPETIVEQSKPCVDVATLDFSGLAASGWKTKTRK